MSTKIIIFNHFFNFIAGLELRFLSTKDSSSGKIRKGGQETPSQKKTNCERKRITSTCICEYQRDDRVFVRVVFENKDQPLRLKIAGS
jgi:hypothetical protein